MLYIDSHTESLKNARKEHVKFWGCRIRKKLTGKDCSNPVCQICSGTEAHKPKSSRVIFNRLIKFLNSQNIQRILGGSPSQLPKINSECFNNILSSKELSNLSLFFTAKPKEKKNPKFTMIHNLIFDIVKIFDYDWFVARELGTDYNAYKLAQNLDMRSCSYCNRIYTTTMVTMGGKKVMRPQFDHWYPKSKSPLLSISFFNLIPSCYTCNSSAKSDIELDIKHHVHPYIDKTQTDDLKFVFFFDHKLKNYGITITEIRKKSTKARDTMKKLNVDLMYNTHIDELADLLKIRDTYSDAYINEIIRFFPKNKLSFKEVFRLLFGTEYDSKNFHKRPLSKFKKDILGDLGILK